MIIPVYFDLIAKVILSGGTRIKRYLMTTKIIMGKSLVIKGTVFKANAPAGGKLRVFNSYKELAAQSDFDGKIKYIDIVKNPELEIRFQPSTADILMKTEDVNKYLQTMTFNIEVFQNNIRYVTRYDPQQMYAFVTFTTDKGIYAKYQQVAKLEKELDAFVQVAQENAKMIHQAQKAALTELQKSKLQEAVVNHNYLINEFSKKLPAEIKLQVQMINVAQLNTVVNIGIVPVIVWVILIIIGTGATAYTAVKVTQLLTDTIKHRNLLLAQQKGIQNIIQAEKLFKEGKITKEGLDTITKKQAANDQVNNQERETMQQNNSRSIFDEAKSLIIWTAAGLLAVKILPGLFNNNNKAS